MGKSFLSKVLNTVSVFTLLGAVLSSPTRAMDPEVPSHYIAFSKATSQNIQLRDDCLTASEAYLKASLGKDYQGNFEEDLDGIIRRFIYKEQGKPRPNDFPLAKKILKKEHKNPTFTVMYTAGSGEYGLAVDVINQISNIKNSTHHKGIRTFRIDEEIISPDILSFLNSQARKVHPFDETASLDYSHGYGAQVLSTNLFLFGNRQNAFSSTYGYFRKGTSQSPPTAPFSMIENIFKYFKIKNHDTYVSSLKEIYNRHCPDSPGRLFQIFVDSQQASKITYLALSGGSPCKITPEGEKESSSTFLSVSDITHLIRNDPFCIPFDTMDTVQGRLFLDRQHSKDVKVFSYYADGLPRSAMIEEINLLMQAALAQSDIQKTPLESGQKDYFHLFKKDEFDKNTVEYFINNPHLLEEPSLDPYDLQIKKWKDFSSFNALFVSFLMPLSPDQQQSVIESVKDGFKYYHPYIFKALQQAEIRGEEYYKFFDIFFEFDPNQMAANGLSNLFRNLAAIPPQEQRRLLNLLKEEVKLEKITPLEINEFCTILKVFSQQDQSELLNFRKEFTFMNALTLDELNALLTKLTKIQLKNLNTFKAEVQSYLEVLPYYLKAERPVNDYFSTRRNIFDMLGTIVDDYSDINKEGEVNFRWWRSRMANNWGKPFPFTAPNTNEHPNEGSLRRRNRRR